MVSSPGDGASPQTNLVLLEGPTGQYVPVSTGFAQTPATAFIAGAGAGIAIAAGQYGAAKALRPSVTNVVQNGASAQ
ncbi:MAG: hypothetical protein M3145_02855, partial [Pseudomonadota bacterium]|nr:hypothetical protein [Pseudomonadota bacterium]